MKTTRVDLDRRRLGTTDLEITTAGFGAWAIGGGGWAYGRGPQDDESSTAAIEVEAQLLPGEGVERLGAVGHEITASGS